jgi:hypothetical protein
MCAYVSSRIHSTQQNSREAELRGFLGGLVNPANKTIKRRSYKAIHSTEYAGLIPITINALIYKREELAHRDRLFNE